MAKCRSPFGTLLRRYRLQLGLSQVRLARRIAELADERSDEREDVRSEKAISNLEAEREPGDHVAPRASTVLILARALGINRGTDEFDEFLRAASRANGTFAAAGGDIEFPSLRPESPGLVTAGREDEIRRLQFHLDKALRGQPQIVFVAGDSGIGKSFLIDHFCQFAVKSTASLVAVLSEASTPNGLGEPYQPFKDLLALLTGDISRARENQLISADHSRRLQDLAVPMTEILVSHGPGLIGPFVDMVGLRGRVQPVAPHDAWWLPVLDRIAAESVGRSTTTADQVHEQVVRVLLELAKRQPIVVVLDDLHWADDRTCELLFYLARRLHRLRGVPLMVIGAYRLADLAVRGPLARHPLYPVINETRRYWGRVVIDLTNTVGNENGRAFIDAIVDAEPNRLDDNFRSMLYQRTEGHPLFVTELRQWLRDRQFLVQDENGVWTAGRSISFDELPPRISAVVAERIDRLPRELRSTMRAASVQGLRFYSDVVGGVRRLDARELARQLDALTYDHRLLIPERSEGAMGAPHQYRFAHSLFQEYLEGSLLPNARQMVHLETAEAILHTFHPPTGHELEIARHFELAAKIELAAEWYLQTGGRSLREFDHESALRWYGHALDLAQTRDNQTLICRASNGMGEALRARGDLSAAIRVGLDALSAAELAESPGLRADCLASLGVYFYDIGNHDQAESYLRESLRLFEDHSLPLNATACSAHYLLSYTLYARGAYSEGIAHAQQALALARVAGFRREEGECLVSVAYYHVDLGDYAAALGFYASALECQRAAKDLRGEAVSLLNIGLCHIELGHLDDARAPLDQALLFAERMRVPRTRAFAMTYFGLMQEALREWPKARASYELAHELRLSTGQGSLAIDPLAGSVRVAIATKDLASARRGTDTILDWLENHGADGIEYPIRVYLALVHALRALDDYDRADRVLAEGKELLMARAATIAEIELRRSFLERVSFNRDLMALQPGRPSISTRDMKQPISPEGSPAG